MFEEKDGVETTEEVEETTVEEIAETEETFEFSDEEIEEILEIADEEIDVATSVMFEEPTIKAANNTKTVGIIAAAVAVIAIIIALAMCGGGRHAIIGTWEDAWDLGMRFEFDGNSNAAVTIFEIGDDGVESELERTNFIWSVESRNDGKFNSQGDWVYTNVEYLTLAERITDEEIEEMREMWGALMDDDDVNEMIEGMLAEMDDSAISTRLTIETNDDGEEILSVFGMDFVRVR